jgi:decaprenylphospho-beta-D-erythro-pentofuranosid-2-ulose 2-reductase
MLRIAILGASSAIAEQCARVWAPRGARFVLVGRRQDLLRSIAADLTVRGAETVECDVADLSALASLPATVKRVHSALGAIDIVLIAQGSLTDEVRAASDSEYLRAELDLNSIGPAVLMNEFAVILSRQGFGTLAVMSSVAGDRGRAMNGTYGSAKAMVTAFASALRQRVSPDGVTVLTIKPGSVDTPMTSDRPKGLLWSSAEHVARDIVAAIDAKKLVLYTPTYWRLVMLTISMIPERLFKRLKF